MICSTFTESERTLKSGINNYQLSAVSVQRDPELARAESQELNATGEASYRTVNDHGHRERPERHAREKRTVGQEQIRGAPAAFALVDQIQVPENPIQGKRNGQAEPGRAELRLCLGANRVEDV